MITELRAKSLGRGETHSEKVGGRGAGTLLLIGRGQHVSSYYRYTGPDGSRPWVELGTLGKEVTLAQARARCAELAAKKMHHPDLKAWLESERVKEHAELEEAQRIRDIAAKTGSFRDVLSDYLDNMETHRQVSAPVVRKAISSEVLEPHPQIVSLKARDIRPEHISVLLKPISARGALVYRNRVRAYLHAAYEFALRHEYDETRSSGKTYGLLANPVAAVPVLRHAEKAGQRALSEIEIRHLYLNLDRVTSVSGQMADFIRFLILTGGQRPLQVSRVTWRDVDFKERTLFIRDLKGKRRDAAGKAHLIPLPEEALAILKSLKPFTGRYEWPFTSAGKVPVSIGSLKNVISRFLNSEFGVLEGEPIEHFTARDLRRSCQQLMTRAGIRRDLRNLLQNHAMTGVDAVNYGHDPAAYLPEKREAMNEYIQALRKVINE